MAGNETAMWLALAPGHAGRAAFAGLEADERRKRDEGSDRPPCPHLLLYFEHVLLIPHRLVV